MYMLNACNGVDLKDKHRGIMKTKKISRSFNFTQQILKDKKKPKQSKSILISFRRVQKLWRGFAITLQFLSSHLRDFF